ncbi:NAD-specific glutamate dehydrogenase [Shigella sonnei]|nr:NAD-specific glutamate dehydrogenase [Shigella sonnei]CSG29025.1 NAD-specific glutamate dehydrogenase [Shigella sonnei]CSH45310.1 NAD-specific glutamate dehydrogenase [Shigella sonnei]CSP23892.1 NAD-specific glutamate dehydrogenase [Shigella sonnei]CSP48614.1 NAD-specific glutamate dehydrogenase [Shigella sonnei]
MGKIFATEEVIASGGVNFNHRRGVFEHRDVKRAATEIKNQRAGILLRMQAICHRSCCGFIN